MRLEITSDMVGNTLVLSDAATFEWESPDYKLMPRPKGDVIFELPTMSDAEVAEYNVWANENQDRGFDDYTFPNGDKIRRRGGPAPHMLDGRTMQAIVAPNCADIKGHVEWRNRNRNRSMLHSSAYLWLDKMYHFQFACRIHSLTRAMLDDEDLGRLTVFQIRGPAYKGRLGRHQHMQPPFAIHQAFKKRMKLQQFGGPVVGAPMAAHHKDLGAVDDEWHTWDIDYRPSITNGKTVVRMDGEEVYRLENTANAIRSADPAEAKVAGMPRWGCYSPPHAIPAIVQHREILLTVEL